MFDYKSSDNDLLLHEPALPDPYTEIKQETGIERLNEQSILTRQIKSDSNLFSLNSDTLLSSLPGNKEQSFNLPPLSSAQQLQQAALKLQAQQQKQAQQQQLLQLLLQQQQQQQQQQQKLSLTTQQLKLLLQEYVNKQQQQQQAVQLQSNNVVTLQTLQQVSVIPYPNVLHHWAVL